MPNRVRRPYHGHAHRKQEGGRDDLLVSAFRCGWGMGGGMGGQAGGRKEKKERKTAKSHRDRRISVQAYKL